jgi:hypothetical protein
MAISATSSRTDGSAPQPLGVMEWLRGRGVTVVAVTLIGVQLALKGALLAGGYFRQDDYHYLDRAAASGFGWSYLMLVDSGHLLPLGMLIAWLQSRLAMYDWPATAGVILLLLAAASFAMLRMLLTVFGRRPGILIPLGIFLFCPLTLAGADWWSVAIEILPLEAATFMAVDAHVRYVRNGRLRTATAAAAWLAVGMAAMEKGAVVPLLLLALTVAFFAPRPLDARRYWRAWAIYGGVLACYAAVFLVQLHTSTVQPGNPGSAGHVFGLIKTMVGTSLLPGALGGPWRWATGSGYDQAAPPVVLQVLSWAVALIIVVATCIWRRRAWRAWAILAGWIVAADFVPVIVGRLGGYPGSLLGAQTRYLTDATGVLALCAGLALLPLAGEEDAYRLRLGPVRLGALRRPLAAASAALICTVAAGSVWSLERLQSVSNATTATARSYIATAQTAVADAPPGTVIVDSAVPAVIMDVGLFWNHALTSDVIGTIATPSQDLSWRQTLRGVVAEPMIFDAQGQLWPATVTGQFSRPGPRVKSGPFARQDCWQPTAAGTKVPLLGSLYRYAWTIRVYYTGSASGLTVGFGGAESTVALTPGTHVAYLTEVGGGKAVTLRKTGGDLCVTGVTIGSLQPDKTRQPIPAVPVAG